MPIKTIFVFGSNTQGRHGRGAAQHARRYHGAIYGQARGLQGDSYAIVTKDISQGNKLRSVPLIDIQKEVDLFIWFARTKPNWIFNVAEIGCGLAGYVPDEIAPMFKDAPLNVVLPESFKLIIQAA